MAETIPFGKGNEPQDPPKAPAGNSVDDRILENRSYSNEEVSEIIRVALSKADTVVDGEVNHDELVSIGREFGLSEADLARAYGSILLARREDEVEQKTMLFFYVHLTVFGVVCFGLFLINMLTDPAHWWWQFVVVSWGMLLGIHGILSKYLPQVASSMFGTVMELSSEFVESRTGISTSSPRVHFKIPQLNWGMAEAQGIVELVDDTLVLEYEVKDTVLRAIKSRSREIRVPVDEIDYVRLDRRFSCTRLHLRGRRVRTFSDVPGAEGGEIKLTFDKSARAASEHLARDLRERISS